MIEKSFIKEQNCEDFISIKRDSLFCRPSLEDGVQFDANRTQELIPAEFADPKSALCDHIIQQVNEIFERDTLCQDPKEYCMTHLLEAVHTSLVWRLSKQ